MRLDLQRPGESRAVIREIQCHVVCGAVCFLILVGMALGTRGDLRDLIWNDPALGLLLGVGALTSFAPLIICVAIESVRRGVQVTLAVLLDMHD